MILIPLYHMNSPRLATLAPGFGSSAGFTGSSNRYTSAGTNNFISANTHQETTLSGGGGEAGTQSQSKWMFTRSSGGRWSFGEAKSKYLSGGDIDLNNSPKLEHKQVDPIRSQIDEDQQHYNAMTSIRAPPRNISPTHDDFNRHQQDADALTTSSATYLTMQPH